MFIPADRLIRRDFKPDFPVRLNRDHPLAPYLSALWLPSTLNPVDLATGQSGWTNTGTINPSISRSGRAVKGDGSTGYLSRSINVSSYRPHLMLAVFEAAVVSATPKTIYSLGSALAGSSAYIRISNGSDTTTPIMAQMRSVANSTLHTATGPAPTVGELYACAWYVSSTSSADNKLWVNGTSYTATGSDLQESGSGTFVHEAIGTLKRGTLAHYSPDHILLVARGIPALGANLDAVLREWTLAPWELLEPEQSRTALYFALAGGSSAAAAGSSAGSSTVLGVGASTHSSTGASAGSSVVSGVGASIHEAAGASAGTATVSGVGDSTSAGSAAGSSAGTATVSGVGASVHAAVGTAAGISSASGVSFVDEAQIEVVLSLRGGSGGGSSGPEYRGDSIAYRYGVSTPGITVRREPLEETDDTEEPPEPEKSVVPEAQPSLTLEDVRRAYRNLAALEVSEPIRATRDEIEREIAEAQADQAALRALMIRIDAVLTEIRQEEDEIAMLLIMAAA